MVKKHFKNKEISWTHLLFTHRTVFSERDIEWIIADLVDAAIVSVECPQVMVVQINKVNVICTQYS